MQDIDAFFDRYNGKSLDVDGYPPEQRFQCVDVWHKFNSDILGLGYVSAQPSGGARDYYQNFDGLGLGNYYVKIANDYNDPNQVPQKGDQIIWGTSVGPFGHIATFSHTDGLGKFVSFDQNWGGTFCHFQSHTYAGVLGWLRPRKFVTQQSQASTGGNDVPVKITLDTARILAHGVLARNGIAGRGNALNGSNDPDLNANHVGRDLTNQYVQDLFLSQEGRDWRDTDNDNSINGINRRLADLTRTKELLAESGIKIDQLNEAIMSLTLERDDLKTKVAPIVGQDAPPAESQPVPAPTPDDEFETVVEAPAEIIPVTVKKPDWRDTYIPEVATYQAKSDVMAIDFSNSEPPRRLSKGQLLNAAGSFKFHNVKYIRTQKSVLDGIWYGVPDESLTRVTPTVDTGEDAIDDLLNDDSWLDAADDIATGIPVDTSTREKAVTAIAKSRGFMTKLASLLQFWKKNK